MIKKLVKYSIVALLLLTQMSCKQTEDEGLYSIYQLDKYNPNKPLISLPSHWVKQADLMTKFPSGIEVYRSEAPINGKVSNIYAVVFNPRRVELKPVLSTTLKTPSKFFSDEGSDVYACINSGFFSGSTSLSLVGYNSAVLSPNVKSFQRPFNGVNVPYYATRAAFGLNLDNKPSVTWVYGVGTGNGEQYSYPTPSPNLLGNAPQIQPSAIFPLGGVLWNQKTMIGGSPMLVKDSIVNITAAEEMVEVDNTSSRPRSAIGYLKNGNIVLLAVEGGNAAGAPGLTLAELANTLVSMGCIGAINLDGGGSSAMVVNGQQTIRPGNSGGAERTVISALIVKKKS